MNYKKSRYNFFFQLNKQVVLAYNAFSNSFAHVNASERLPVIDILGNPNVVRSGKHERLKKKLIEGSFLIDRDLDEVELLKLRNKIGRFSTEYLGLTIIPTLACNFDCTYCYEKDSRSESMDKSVEKALTDFVSHKMETSRKLSVTWFGGEPLLKIDVIERLSSIFEKICNANSATFLPQKMITNGYLLSKKNAKTMNSLNITTAQITLDGPADVHDKRRHLKNGCGTYDTIVSNIRDASEYIDITIRINADRNNCHSISELLDNLQKNGILDVASLYVGRVCASTEACHGIAKNCFDVKEFAAVVMDETTKRTRNRSLSLYPSQTHFGVCCADSLNAYVVSPSGALFKCWSQAGFDERHSIGTVFNEEKYPYQVKNLTSYLNWDPFGKKACVRCKYLPICGGGCPYFALHSMDHCTTWKYYLERMLKVKYHELKEGG